ncbi:uncharacterized protein E5676_scaffold349G00540 [Cucumis melo var. makuwa]|uniref:Uncharacterized protein n=1 Tax=Cucumis melo var. makuwa TaxID=1194695 RepID=A0A5A7SXN5_CUCMM|nr:uncharacterized protein E6C27_scaffold56G001670 [Cucumis melo var. makuwa]TYK30441.1 uncharacterized protein E5676_scaffold349G00540 [Cucumis melo var. makuwa]
MDLCREIVWNCPSNGIQYSKIEEVDKIYVFLVHHEEDHTSVMNSLTTPTIGSDAFNVESPSHDNERHNGKPIPICEHCKKQWHIMNNVESLSHDNERPVGCACSPPHGAIMGTCLDLHVGLVGCLPWAHANVMGVCRGPMWAVSWPHWGVVRAC